MFLKKLSKKEKENLVWLLDFIERRALTNADIKKYTNKKINDTVWLSIHDVSTIIKYLVSNTKELEKFKESFINISYKESEKLFAGILQEHIKKCTT